MTKVSIILPNYNYERFLPERIESILNQAYKDFELIVLDDFSPDGSVELIKSYLRKDNRIKFIGNKENSGNPFLQWQKGIKESKGEYIWIAEADDFADMFDDLKEGLVTPYTYYLKYHDQRQDLINPFELYWTVVSNLIPQ